MDDSNIELASASLNANVTMSQHNLDFNLDLKKHISKKDLVSRNTLTKNDLDVRDATDCDLATEISDADPTDVDILSGLDHSDDIDLDDAGNDVSNVTVQSAKAHDVNKEENEEMSFMDLSLADFNDTTEDILQVCSYSVFDQ